MKTPTCPCHDKPMLWNKRREGTPRAPGNWYCAVKGLEKVLRYQRGKGYVTRRRRELGVQRERVVNELRRLTEDGLE